MRSFVAPAGLCLAALTAACVRSAGPEDRRPDAVAPASPTPRLIARRRKCMGTVCDFKAFHHDEALVERAFRRGFEEIDRLEALMTSWRPTSEVSRINEAAGKTAVVVSPETLAVLEKALWVAELTDGAFDVTVGAFRGLWKFDEDNDGTLPDPKEVARRRKLVDWRDVIVDRSARTVMLRRRGQRLNIEGIAKGYAIDAAVRTIRAAGVNDFIAQAGGDLFAAGTRGPRPWRVGIQDPRAPRGRILFELPVSDQAFNTSGDYERFILKEGTRYHHILDPRTGFPARRSRSATLLAPDAFTADALDTALFVVGPERALEILQSLSDVEAVIIDAENRVHVSPGLKANLVKRADPSPGI